MNKLLSFRGICHLLLAASILVSCDRYRVYEKNIDFTNKFWYADSLCTYHFAIEDASVKYNILYNVRNTLNYPFHNLYVKYTLADTTGKQLISDLQEMQLMDAKTGEPYGSGLRDIYDNKIYALKEYTFPRAGFYSFTVKQYMRKDPLDEIMAFGIRVEKSAK